MFLKKTHKASQKSKKSDFHEKSMQITEEPIITESYLKMSAEDRRLFESYYYRINENPKEAEKVLKNLIDKYPDHLPLQNNLIGVYEVMGQMERVFQMIEEMYEKHPDYLFAKSSYARLKMKQGDPDAVTKIYRGFTLADECPDRDTFHISEFIDHCSVFFDYFCLKGQYERAEMYASMAKNIDPDNPNVIHMDRLISLLIPRTKRALIQAKSRYNAKILNQSKR